MGRVVYGTFLKLCAFVLIFFFLGVLDCSLE